MEVTHPQAEVHSETPPATCGSGGKPFIWTLSAYGSNATLRGQSVEPGKFDS